MDRSRQSQRLLQIGVALFLIAVILGLAIPQFTVPRLALSAHLIGYLSYDRWYPLDPAQS